MSLVFYGYSGKATQTEPRDFVCTSQRVSKEGLEQRGKLGATSEGSRTASSLDTDSGAGALEL